MTASNTAFLHDTGLPPDVSPDVTLEEWRRRRSHPVRTTVSLLASTLAAAGGILTAPRLLAVNQSVVRQRRLPRLEIAGPVTGGVLLVAVSLDALGRQRGRARGRH